MVIASGSNTLSQEIFTYLSDDLDTTLPALPDVTGSNFIQPVTAGNALYEAISKILNTDLTTGVVGGTGVFDVLMTALKAHLTAEHQAGRITGDQYTKAYIDATGRALEISTQFLLNREQTYWQSLMVRAQAQRAEVERVTARIQLETAKSALAQAHAQAEAQLRVQAAQYSLTKMNLSVADRDFVLKGVQKDVGTQEVLLKTEQVEGAAYTNTNILPAQKKLLDEQGESQRAQTKDTRTDNSAVMGTMGKQKELYTQQIDSYKKEAQYKVGKILTDTWITRKTLNDSISIPTSLVDTEVNEVMTAMRTANDL